ncbi:MAG: hypothetical protein AABX51_08110 [Nanoarchaeota archaeon]
MTFKGKTVKVILTGDALEQFDELNKLVGEEIKEGINKSDHQILLNSIKQKLEFLKSNPQYGIHIPKDRIPKEYTQNYDANNLWKVNLSGAWRMIYTINGNEIEIIALILDIINHKDYDKKFGYRRK